MKACYDVIVVGAGIIGASAAHCASRHFATALLEQEPAPGYHSSGRSAAVLLPPYGGPLARALTAASRPFLAHPPNGFHDSALIKPRGAILIARPGHTQLLERWRMGTNMQVDAGQSLSSTEAVDRVPILRRERIAAAVYMPEVADIDASNLLHGFLRAFRANDGDLFLNSGACDIRRSSAGWVVDTGNETLRSKILINAAGAWADSLAQRAGVAPLGLVPTRRTMCLIRGPETLDFSKWPMVADAGEEFYFKPDAGRLALSPADRTVAPAEDCLPEDLDVAIGIDRFETATSMAVRRVEHKWAGLRTFSPDEEPVVGFDPDVPSFLWMAGFGGFGIQASVGAGLCCEALLREQKLSSDLLSVGVDLERLSPRRFGAG